VSELPLFPLRTVLFPGGLLPLRIFETRYVDMVRRCMREGGEFGVLLISSESEGDAGPNSELATIGTTANIVDFHALPDGLLGLMCRGARRFKLRTRRVQPDGLYIGDVEWLAEPAPSAVAPEHLPLARLLRRVLHKLGDTARHLDADFGDAGWVSNRLAEFLPLERSAQQQLLELEDPQRRMSVLAPLIEVPPEAAEAR
jgi:uncharacterized protein